MNLLSWLFGKSFGRRTSVSQKTEDLIKRDWEQIGVLLDQKGPSQLKQALIKADKSLDNALKDMFDGDVGDVMADRLKAAKTRFDIVTYNKIWEAHKVRNALVHESGYEPPYYVLTEAVEHLRRGLERLGINV